MNNEKKLQYKEPQIEVVAFSAQDIITTSGNGWEGEDDSLIIDLG